MPTTAPYAEFRRALALDLTATVGDVAGTYDDAIAVIDAAAGGVGGFAPSWHPGRKSTSYDPDAVRAAVTAIVEGIRAVRAHCAVGDVWRAHVSWGGLSVERIWPGGALDMVRVYADARGYHIWDGEARAEVPVASTPLDLVAWLRTRPDGAVDESPLW